MLDFGKTGVYFVSGWVFLFVARALRFCGFVFLCSFHCPRFQNHLCVFGLTQTSWNSSDNGIYTSPHGSRSFGRCRVSKSGNMQISVCLNRLISHKILFLSYRNFYFLIRTHNIFCACFKICLQPKVSVPDFLYKLYHCMFSMFKVVCCV